MNKLVNRLDEGSRSFYKKMFKIGIPIVFQNFINIGLNLIDTLMIGKLGEESLAAVGIANQVFFVFSITLFGLLSGVAIYTTQYFGAGDRKGVQKMMGIGISVALAFAFIISIITFLFSTEIIGLYSNSAEVIRLGSGYLHLVVPAYIFFSVSIVISFNSRAVQDLTVPTFINFIAILINVILNYGLIFGEIGLPNLGVNGAAVATTIARFIEMIALISFIFIEKDSWLRGSFRELFGFDRILFKKVMKTATPVIIAESNWAISTAMIFAAYGLLGTSAVATIQVVNVTSEFLQSFYFGVGSSTAMIIGETIGKGQLNEAYLCGKRAFKVIWILNILLGVLLVIISKPITLFYDFSLETNELIVETIIVMAFALTPKMIAYMYIVGIFRAGGDTMFTMKLEFVCNLFIQVPIAFFVVGVLGVSLPMALALVTLGEFVRIYFSRKRFHSKVWINHMIE